MWARAFDAVRVLSIGHSERAREFTCKSERRRERDGIQCFHVECYVKKTTMVM